MTNRYIKADSVAIRILQDGTREALRLPRNTKVLRAEDWVATIPLVEVEWNSEKLLMFADELLRQEELEQAIGDAERSDEGRFEELAFTMAHDLKAPLRSIGSITELFLNRMPTKLDRESIAMLQYVVNGAARMNFSHFDSAGGPRRGGNGSRKSASGSAGKQRSDND